MDESALRESRQLLRRIQEHLFEAHASFGVQHETLGFVDVIHHPTNALPDLNYVTPRRNTAWVSGQFVQKGLDRLIELDRTPRVQYIEGLYPPLFANTLVELKLQPERKTALMVYANQPAPPRKPPTPSGVRLELVDDQRGLELWGSIWLNPAYDLLTLGVEPLAVGRDMAALTLGQQIDVLMYRQDVPVGVVRMGVQAASQSAHVVALALLHEVRRPHLIKVLLAAGLRAALVRGCTLIFAPGASEADRASRELGFVEMGSMVCYAMRVESASKGQANDGLVQPVLAVRR